MATPLQQFNGQPSQQNAHQAWNNGDATISGAGAVQTPNRPNNVLGSLSPSTITDSRDAIREGKQKAQETMAAAGLSVSASVTAQGGDQTANGESNGTPQLSRKRSRDGTQLPMKQTQTQTKAIDGEDARLHNEILLDRYVQRDLRHGGVIVEQSERSAALITIKEKEKEFYVHDVRQRRAQNPGSVFGYGYLGYGNGLTDGPCRILYSSLRHPPKGRRAPQPRTNRKDNDRQATQLEQLVPVRLDIELDKLRLRDTFTWNLQEKNISPALFTDHLLEDLRIPPEAGPEIARQVAFEIEDQTRNFYPHMIIEDGALEQGRPYIEYKDDEMRIQIKLHITIGRITLIDQFEWDINNPLNSPEEFARQMAWENALSGEFTTAIAHSIREQSHQYTKSLWLTNHVFDGRPIEDPEVRDSFLPAPIHSSFRPQQAQKDWMPYMYEMTEADLDRTETIMMREHRAQKRQLNRRGGPALPDLKERQRTVRSLFVHSVIPGAVETWETSGIPKTRRGGRGGRRPGARGADEDIDSSDLDSEDEAPESPAPPNLLGAVANTGRTRGMRGAASAAQAAMRANLGRSTTPDSQLAAPAPHDTRPNMRRSLLREGSAADDADALIVRLRIGKAKYRAWWDDYRAKKRASEYPLSGYASQPTLPVGGAMSTPQRAVTPRKDATGAGTPALASRSLPSAANGAQHDSQGRVEAAHWPTADDVPVSTSAPSLTSFSENIFPSPEPIST